MIKFRTDGHNDKIIGVDVDGETDKSVYIGKYRNAKRSIWLNYFDTWEDAKLFLIETAEKDIEILSNKMEALHKKLDNIHKLINIDVV